MTPAIVATVTAAIFLVGVVFQAGIVWARLGSVSSRVTSIESEHKEEREQLRDSIQAQALQLAEVKGMLTSAAIDRTTLIQRVAEIGARVHDTAQKVTVAIGTIEQHERAITAHEHDIDRLRGH